MSVVQPGGGQRRGGGQERGQRPAPPGGRPPAQKRPPSKQQGARTSTGGRGTQRTPPSRTQPQSRGVAKQKPTQRAGQRPVRQQKGRRNVPVQAAPPRRLNPTALTIGAIGVVVVIVVALVIVKVTGSSNNPNAIAPVNTPASATVMAKVTGVSPSVMNAVGVPSSSLVAPPSIQKGQPVLTIDGKPGGFAVLAEFCPYCAAMRWPMIVSLSQFGTFSGVKETTSSPWDSYPATATFSFYGATYTSQYINFKLTENETDDSGPNGAGRKQLVPLTSQEANLDVKYSEKLGLTEQGFPFIDIGNKVFVTSPLYNPQNLQGLDQSTIASGLSNANNPATQAIVGTANYLTAGICSIDGQQPASVCSVTAVTKAAKAMGIS